MRNVLYKLVRTVQMKASEEKLLAHVATAAGQALFGPLIPSGASEIWGPVSGIHARNWPVVASSARVLIARLVPLNRVTSLPITVAFRWDEKVVSEGCCTKLHTPATNDPMPCLGPPPRTRKLLRQYCERYAGDVGGSEP